MKRIIISIFFICCLFQIGFCFSEEVTFPEPGEAKVLNATGIETLIFQHDKIPSTPLTKGGYKLVIVNFWATWCPPCVKELPYFVEAYEKFKDESVLFVGFSNDFLKSWENTVPPFLKKHQVPYPNFVLDVDANELIPRFSEEWTGAIPATFYFDGKGNKLGEKLEPLTLENLNRDIELYLGLMENNK